MTTKSLDTKIANILANPSCNDFILADAKDADMAGGMAAPGQSPEHHADEARFRSLSDYRQLMRENLEQGLIDILLMSASSNEVLTIKEKLFENSAITPAARANDTSDIWLAMGGQYPSQPSRPYRTATIDHIMCGKAACEPSQKFTGADLGLYSLTFNNDLDTDHLILEKYNAFRIEAEKKGFRHFLELFNPNACGDHCPDDIGRFINDMIARTLAGVTKNGRPIFLKIPYPGPAAMEQLASYDRTLIPGILGGSSGTTFDAFFQLSEAKKYGARAALYGRMINNSEHQLSFIQHLRWIADGEIPDPAQAVKSYHGELQKLGISPYRSLQDDLVSTLRNAAYGGKSTAVAVNPSTTATASASTPAAAATTGLSSNPSEPDFANMTPAQKIQWNLKRWNQII